MKASDALGCKDLQVLTDNVEREEKASWFGLRGTIRYVPLWKWLIVMGTVSIGFRYG